MSQQHPVVVVTGSSGAGTTYVKHVFEGIFAREAINPVIIEGDSFHRYDRAAMKEEVAHQLELGNNHFSHFGPDANEFSRLADLFKHYGQTGGGQKRLYLHSDEEAVPYEGLYPGQFTPWEDIEKGTDLLFYEGLHGMVRGEHYDVAKHVDLSVGVTPTVALEWIQKIYRDNKERAYPADVIVDTILTRMPDYVKHISAQFDLTDINIQRVPTVDHANPFKVRPVPTADESIVIIGFRNPCQLGVDFDHLMTMLHDSFMSSPTSIVVPGGKFSMACDILLTPIIQNMIANRG